MNPKKIANVLRSINRDKLKAADEELFNRYGNRYRKYRENYQKALEFEKEFNFPLYLLVEQTYQCNLRCPSCLQGHKAFKRSFDMNIKQMPRELYDKVVLEGEEHECPSIAMHVVDEPLLVKDLPDRIAFAKKHGFMDIIMTTNGNLFTEEKIKAVQDAGITRILFSMDACTHDTYNVVRPGGNLDKVMWALEQTINYRNKRKSALPVIRASFVVSKMNQHELPLFVEKMSKIVDYIDIQSFSPYMDVNKHMIPDNAIPLNEFHCNELEYKTIIRADGTALPCCSFYGYNVPLGNIYEHSIYEIFNSNKAKELRKEFQEGKYLNTACQNCSKSMYVLK